MKAFGDEVKRRIMLGSFALSAGAYDEFFKKAAQVRTLICRDFEKIFAEKMMLSLDQQLLSQHLALAKNFQTQLRCTTTIS